MLGAVLNGGQSTRMGEDKSSLVFDGLTFVERAVMTVEAVADHVVVIGSPAGDVDVEVLSDAVPDAGPLAGLVTAFHRAAGEPVLVLAVDLPLVSSSLLAAVSTALVRPDQAVVVRQDGRPQPLCAVYGAGLIELAHHRLATDDRSMRTFLRSVPLWSMLDVPTPTVWNINTPEDLQRLRDESPNRPDGDSS
ncbi:MAG: molybdenum cofactor guanylyltransferase [Acidimicrobiia bacterium]